MKYFFLCVAAAFTIFASSCKSPQMNDSRQVLVVSILPQSYFVQKIAGDNYRVEVMVPPGTSPETYEPTARQMKEVANSIAYFSIGHIDFELSLLRKLRSMNPDVRFIDTSEGTDLISDHFHTLADGTIHHHGADPHIWLSPKEVKIQAKNIYKALTSLHPENTETFLSNYEKFLLEIEEVDAKISELLSNVKGKTILVYHPAFVYLARDYDFNQEGIEFEGKNPTPSHLKRLVNLANSQNIKTIFVQKEYEIQYSNTLAREIGADVVILDDLSPDWSSNMIDIAKKIKASFSE